MWRENTLARGMKYDTICRSFRINLSVVSCKHVTIQLYAFLKKTIYKIIALLFIIYLLN